MVPHAVAATHAEETHKRRWRIPLWLGIPTTLYFLALAILAGADYLGPDQWWWSAFNLYLPQWLWLIPGGALLVGFCWKAWRWAWIPLLGLFWVAFPMMGFRWRWTTPVADPAKGTRLRVMTYNVKGGARGVEPIVEDIRRHEIDLLLLQESSGSRMYSALKEALAGWNVTMYAQFVIASRRYPVRMLEQAQDWRDYRDHAFMRAQLMVGSTPVTLYSVHLLSPRYGLVASKRSIKFAGRAAVQDNANFRLKQTRMLAERLKTENRPLIVAGDLNAPEQSLVCRALCETGLRDAFSLGGRGYGYTYGQYMKWRLPHVRIDHILLSDSWQVMNCWVGNKEGSDHRPVIADLYLPYATN